MVEIQVAGEKFRASGLQILEKNYLEVYPYDKWTDKPMAVYQEGDTFQPTYVMCLLILEPCYLFYNFGVCIL